MRKDANGNWYTPERSHSLLSKILRTAFAVVFAAVTSQVLGPIVDSVVTTVAGDGLIGAAVAGAANGAIQGTIQGKIIEATTGSKEAPPPDDVRYAPSMILVGLRGDQIEARDLAIAQLNQLREMRTAENNLLTETAKIIRQIDESGGIVTISPGRGLSPYTTPEGRYNGPGTNSKIEYDPYSPEALVDLAHELVHGRDFAVGTYQSGDWWHMDAYRVQNQIAYELEIPIQTQWGNKDDPVIIHDPGRYVDRKKPPTVTPPTTPQSPRAPVPRKGAIR